MRGKSACFPSCASRPVSRRSGAVFEEEVAPMTLEFQENRVSLTGSVQEQFEQWGEILREMYLLEIGE